jgi:hypothetical protein
MTPATTTIVARVASDKLLQQAIQGLYGAQAPSRPHQPAHSWRLQLALLIEWQGRATVIEALQEAAPHLTMRQAVILADLASREESGIRAGVVAHDPAVP